MKRYLYDLLYTDGYLITHYDVNKMIELMNDHNKEEDYNHQINKNYS